MNSIIKMTIATLLLVSYLSPLLAQDNSKAPPAPPCGMSEHFSDFDFWLGEWDVFTNDDKRTLQGTNSITRHHENCLIMENWTNVQGGTGSSMNYYDVVSDQWRQLWVAGGYSIDYTGGLDATGAMTLNGKINYYQTGKSHDFRGTWSKNTDGSVRQLFEQRHPKTGKWAVWFDGLYVKR